MSNDDPAVAPAPLAAYQTSASRTYDFAQVDVFAERALEGNALAIFTDARGLSSGEMQALARETNLSETTFILPRAPEIERERGVHVRIFLTTEEVPFAGHPTLGTASWLYLNHPIFRGAEEITLDLGVGPIRVRFRPPQPREIGVFGTMRQNEPTFGEALNSSDERAALANALNIPVEDLDPTLPAQIVSTGMAFCIVPLRSMKVATRLRINAQNSRQFLDRVGAKFFFCIASANANSGAQWHARMQFDSGEDPATGSASGCTIAYLVRHGRVASGQQIILEQGIEMLRPSRIHLSASLEDNRVTKVFVGGRTIPVASGRLFLP
ncbi:PhzF family phenazine biosynthesis protein [Tunturiibacter gelidoferens]|uniref:Trans-2,3-dihydro-3-hydroxyanthranilate isomerase n=1 Tax=Tunturiibacter gelidiferens TaxID=3069689 RepID=A0A9X0QDV9_9BACT|nr:PhzF family phenazine biosynthesis protein [Edaphobacter lichenicola]MBB5328484.1 trans-2,3-dihydro-3-hydroxyanthranilate isomerase [Edaphobacter lichenicola]